MHAEMVVQTEEDEQAVHVVSVTVGHPASQPVVAKPSSLKKLAKQEKAEQAVEVTSQEVHVAPATAIALQALQHSRPSLRQKMHDVDVGLAG